MQRSTPFARRSPAVPARPGSRSRRRAVRPSSNCSRYLAVEDVDLLAAPARCGSSPAARRARRAASWPGADRARSTLGALGRLRRTLEGHRATADVAAAEARRRRLVRLGDVEELVLRAGVGDVGDGRVRGVAGVRVAVRELQDLLRRDAEGLGQRWPAATLRRARRGPAARGRAWRPRSRRCPR